MQELIFLKTLKFFLHNPYEEVYLRQLAAKLKISPFAIKKYTGLLIKENLIKEEKRANLKYFKADINNLFFKYLKIAYSIRLLLNSVLLNYLNDNLSNISSIILFGSMAKGMDNKDSDVDLLIISKKKSLNLIKFEEKIQKKINYHIFTWSEWNKKQKEDKAFYYEIINYGIPLQGELPVIGY